MERPDLRVVALNFNAYCSPALLAVRPRGGRTMTMLLHNVDGLRQSPRGRGLDAEPREQYGAVEVPARLLARLDGEPEANRRFVREVLGGRRFTDVQLMASASEVRVEQLGWTLARRARG
jgi:hypothetical protein